MFSVDVTPENHTYYHPPPSTTEPMYYNDWQFCIYPMHHLSSKLEICLFTWKKPNPVNTEKLKNLSLVSFIRGFVMFSFFVLFKKFSVFSFLMKLGAMVQMVANIYFCVQGLNLSTFTLLMLYYNAAKRLETGSYWYQRLLF